MWPKVTLTGNSSFGHYGQKWQKISYIDFGISLEPDMLEKTLIAHLKARGYIFK